MLAVRQVNVCSGSFTTGWNHLQVQPCPLFADRYRSGEPLNPTLTATTGHEPATRLPRRRDPPV